MEYRLAGLEDARAVYELVQNAIKSVYPKYYPGGVVEFFCKHHSIENIEGDIKKKCVYMLLEREEFVGTGTYVENEITRVFVKPTYQGKCHSIPTILDNGKLQMSEEWQWLNGDYSKGKSMLIEK